MRCGRAVYGVCLVPNLLEDCTPRIDRFRAFASDSLHFTLAPGRVQSLGTTHGDLSPLAGLIVSSHFIRFLLVSFPRVRLQWGGRPEETGQRSSQKRQVQPVGGSLEVGKRCSKLARRLRKVDHQTRAHPRDSAQQPFSHLKMQREQLLRQGQAQRLPLFYPYLPTLFACAEQGVRNFNNCLSAKVRLS
jgi:hypothetical protein